MDKGPAHRGRHRLVRPVASSDRGRGESGATTASTILAMGLALLLFVNLAQWIVWQYGRGSVRASLDEAARVGAGTAGSVEECQLKADDVLGDLLGGSMGDDVVIVCRDTGTAIVAEATVSFRAWLPPTPDWTFTVSATAPLEPRAEST